MQNYKSVTFILTTGGWSGYWSKGDNLGDAARKLKKAGAQRSDQCFLRIVFNDLEAFVNENGAVCYGGSTAPDAWLLTTGAIGNLGSILKFNPEK